MFSKYEQDVSLKFRLQEARMLNNSIQYYWKIVVERLYYIIQWLEGVCISQKEWRCLSTPYSNYSCRAVCSKISTTRRCGWHPSSPWCVEAGFPCWRKLLLIIKIIVCSKNVFLFVNSNVVNNYWMTQVSRKRHFYGHMFTGTFLLLFTCNFNRVILRCQIWNKLYLW